MVVSRELRSDRFPRSNGYNPSWLTENPMGAHPLWLTEWLCERIELRAGMRVLDLGCGKAKSSVFLAREYGVQVWATDLWTGASENRARIEDAGVGDRVFPIHANARNLPFAGEFFDVVMCIDSYNYFGTDDGYLPYLVHFVRPGGTLAFASAGLMQDFGAHVPGHLEQFWTSDCWTIHTASWWRHHLAKTALVSVERAEALEDGWGFWLAWAEATGASRWYRDALATDAGRYLGYVGVTATRLAGRPIQEYAWPATLRSGPRDYQRHPLLRDR
jgi:SAM-dependent methyltransferase